MTNQHRHDWGWVRSNPAPTGSGCASRIGCSCDQRGSARSRRIGSHPTLHGLTTSAADTRLLCLAFLLDQRSGHHTNLLSRSISNWRVDTSVLLPAFRSCLFPLARAAERATRREDTRRGAAVNQHGLKRTTRGCWLTAACCSCAFTRREPQTHPSGDHLCVRAITRDNVFWKAGRHATTKYLQVTRLCGACLAAPTSRLAAIRTRNSVQRFLEQGLRSLPVQSGSG